MKYEKKMILKNGKTLLLRNAGEADAAAVLRIFQQTHAETEYLLTYPEENTFGEKEEAAFLKRMDESENEIEILAFVDGCLAGSAGIEAVGSKLKIRHRAEFGISVLKAYWGMGIGHALTAGCIECAEKAGFEQLELEAAAENLRAISLYRRFGFQEFGRNPKGFKRKNGTYQELVSMRLEIL